MMLQLAEKFVSLYLFTISVSCFFSSLSLSFSFSFNSLEMQRTMILCDVRIIVYCHNPSSKSKFTSSITLSIFFFFIVHFFITIFRSCQIHFSSPFDSNVLWSHFHFFITLLYLVTIFHFISSFQIAGTSICFWQWVLRLYAICDLWLVRTFSNL